MAVTSSNFRPVPSDLCNFLEVRRAAMSPVWGDARPRYQAGRGGKPWRCELKTSDGGDESPVKAVGTRGMMSEAGRQIRDSVALTSSSLSGAYQSGRS
jgi:hypothetical protein